MTRLSDDAIAAIRARADAASEGPWRAKGFGFGVGVCHGFQDDAGKNDVDSGILNAAFIAAARTDIPALLAHIAALDGELAEVAKVRDDYGAQLKELRAEESIAGEPWAWAVHDDTSTIPCDEGGTCDYTVEYSKEEAAEAARHHRDRLWDEQHFPTEEQCDEAVTVVPLYPRTMHHLAIAERDTLAAKLAEVERERDEMRRLLIEFGPFRMRAAEVLADEVAAMVRRREIDARCPAADALLDFRNPPERFAPNVKEQLDAALAEQRRLAAEVERMRPVIEAVTAWRVVERTPERWRELGRSLSAVGRAVDAYLAAPQPPAVDREASLDELARLSQEFGGYEELREPGNAEVVSAIRALPDEEPPSGYVERAEVRRLEVAAVEAVMSWRDGSSSLAAVDAALDALRAACEKAGA